MKPLFLKQTENEIVKASLEYLQARNIPAIRMNVGAVRFADENGRRNFVRFGTPGMSDILGILPDGRALAVECKTANGKLSNFQSEFLDAIRHNNGVAIVARSVEDIESGLKEVGF
ncbi:MAG: VRR-NUC domain-containing protein [Treponema sp.]|jgi:hypothetical protein|nr:VRR-NUC domain-containing protein [Treponema sp.]